MFMLHSTFVNTKDKRRFKSSLYRLPILSALLILFLVFATLYFLFLFPYQISGGVGFGGDILVVAIAKQIFTKTIHPILFILILALNYFQISKVIGDIDKKNLLKKNYQDLINLNKYSAIFLIIFSLFSAMSQNPFLINLFFDMVLIMTTVFLWFNFSFSKSDLKREDYTIPE